MLIFFWAALSIWIISIQPNVFKSYESLALENPGADSSGYIRAGLGFADGKGIYSKRLRGELGPFYKPYDYQGAGTPFVIGIMAKYFGRQSVFPYVILTLSLHYFVAVLVMILATEYTQSQKTLFLSGLLSLFCLPVFNFNYSFGMLLSEPLTGPFLVATLIFFERLWRSLEVKPKLVISRRQQLAYAFAFGFMIGATSYFRDLYTNFFAFCCLLLVLRAFKTHHLKRTLVLIAVASATLLLIQLPWRARNQLTIGQFCMSATTNYYRSLWYGIWDNYLEQNKIFPGSGLGLGHYLSPADSERIKAELLRDPQGGSIDACLTLMRGILHSPVKAITFKLNSYDNLWLGQRGNIPINLWNATSLIALISFWVVHRNKFYAGLFALPLFILVISPLIHYEPRYAHPVYWLITPIAVSCLIEMGIKKLRPIKGEVRRNIEQSAT